MPTRKLLHYIFNFVSVSLVIIGIDYSILFLFASHQVFAEETDADYRHSSSATLIVEVTDTNDNSPKFDNPTYMASVNESSLPGTVVTTITATDRDSGKNGQEGIVYEMIGDGADR